MQPEQLIERTLAYYNAGVLQSFERLKHGFANENYKITTDKGNFLFRIHRQQSPENVEKEHALLTVLKREAFPAAFPVKDKSGNTWHEVEGNHISLYDFVEGKIPVLCPETVAEAARTLARLHTLDTAGVPPKANSTHPEKVAQTLSLFSSAQNPLPDIFKQFSLSWEKLSPSIIETLPTGIIHSDLFPDNTLFKGHRLKAVIDFEEYAIGPLLFDVAMAINGFCFKNNQLNNEWLDAFLKAYNQKRPLTPQEEKLLPVYIRWAALAMASWHLRFHLVHRPDTKQEKRVRELLERTSR